MILTYNPLVVHSNFSFLRAQGIVSPEFSDKHIAMYADTPIANKSLPLIDRSGGMKHFLGIQVVDLFPTLPSNFSKPFSQIVIERAQELLATGKRINILWSGGIDSTLALFALLSQCKDSDQVRVLCTYDSVLESGGLFDKHIVDKVPYVLGTRLPKNVMFEKCELNTSKDLVITGCCADQILNAMPFSKDFSPEYLEFLKPALDKSPRPLDGKEDYEWYFRFNFMWTGVKYSTAFGLDPKYAGIIHAFYDTDDFQRWAILGYERSNFEVKHKSVARELIYKLTGEEDYAYNKPKTWSTFASNDLSSKAFFLSTGETIYLHKN